MTLRASVDILPSAESIAQWLDALLPTVVSAAALLVDQQSYLHEDDIYTKADGSRVTRMDILCHSLIDDALRLITPHIPVISEEGIIPEWEQRKKWTCYWSVDPLDGTRSYIDGSSHFAISIGLIVNHAPVAGILASPATHQFFLACPQRGAVEWHLDNTYTALRTARSTEDPRILVSSDPRYLHQPSVMDAFPGTTFIPMGSALKYICLAQGLADLYLRRAPFSEWDCAAGQALVTMAGGIVCDASGEVMHYNNDPSLEKNYILACSNEELFTIVRAFLSDNPS